jgi:rRNA-processing protein FCF1
MITNMKTDAVEPKMKENLYRLLEKKALEEQGTSAADSPTVPSFLDFCQLPVKAEKISVPAKSFISASTPVKSDSPLPSSFLDYCQLPGSKDSFEQPAVIQKTNSQPNRAKKQSSSSDKSQCKQGILQLSPESLTQKQPDEYSRDSVVAVMPTVHMPIATKSTIPISLIVTVYCILDTNVYVENFSDAQLILGHASVRIVVPQIVTRELDGLKKNERLSQNAQKANRLLLNFKNKVIGQLPHETISQEQPKTADEAIIWCAAYFKKNICENTFVVSSDKNLQVQAIYHFGLSSLTPKQFLIELVKYDIGLNLQM